jgi:hypothetical protein
MQYQLQNNKKALLLLFLLPFLSGCTSLKDIDQKLGEVFFNEEKIEISAEKVEEETQDKLSPDLKEKIDKWLKENDLNRYGDSLKTYYTGGTPLFNETTGESTERFEYIFQKIPDILEKIN